MVPTGLGSCYFTCSIVISSCERVCPHSVFGVAFCVQTRDIPRAWWGTHSSTDYMGDFIKKTPTNAQYPYWRFCSVESTIIPSADTHFLQPQSRIINGTLVMAITN